MVTIDYKKKYLKYKKKYIENKSNNLLGGASAKIEPPKFIPYYLDTIPYGTLLEQDKGELDAMDKSICSNVFALLSGIAVVSPLYTLTDAFIYSANVEPPASEMELVLRVSIPCTRILCLPSEHALPTLHEKNLVPMVSHLNVKFPLLPTSVRFALMKKSQSI